MDTSERVLDLFFHRRDVFVHQYHSEQSGRSGYSKVCAHQPPWIRGKCPHRKPDTKCGQCGQFEPLSINPKIVKMHLDGAVTLGAYQIGSDGVTVRWGCLDFDDHGLCSEQELQDAALVAQESLASYGLPSYFEASGGTGWRCHLWVFFADAVAAIKVKVVLDSALRQAALHDKPYIERFPKQARALNGYGNLVKVPFGVHRKTRKRSQFLNDKLEPVSIDEALGMIQEVDPMGVDMVIDVRGLTLEEPATREAAPARDFNYPLEAMHRILSTCEYFKLANRVQRANDGTLHYEDWWNCLLMFSRFGDAGVKWLLEFSQADDRFNAEHTIKLINYIREKGYHAPSCRRLREGPGQLRCPLDPLECGAAHG